MDALGYVLWSALAFTLYKILRALEVQSKPSAIIFGISVLMICFSVMNYAWMSLWNEQVLRPIMYAQTIVMIVIGVSGIIYSIYNACRQKQ